MDDIYRDLMKNLRDLRTKQASGQDMYANDSVDRLFDDPIIKRASSKPVQRRISSMRDLVGFRRVSNDVLIQKSTQDFWKLTKDANGNDVIEKLHDGSLVS